MNRFLKKILAPGPTYHWRKVFFIIIFTAIALSGTTAASYIFYRYTKYSQARFAAGVIQAIVHTTPQTGPEYTALQTSYLAEVLGLSTDEPSRLGEFDLEEAKQKLLATYAIQEASLKKMKPDLLFVQYQTRVPYAFLEDYTNTALDKEGFLFPFAPLYTPRHLPKIYLGENRPPEPWGKTLETTYRAVVNEICTMLGCDVIERIDLSHFTAPTSGKREIVVLLKKDIILRLPSKNYAAQLENYILLSRTLLKANEYKMVDFRIPEVAYLQKRIL